MIAEIQRPVSLPDLMTIDQVAGLAGVGRATVHKAVFQTKAGLVSRGATNFLPRASRCRAGFRASDVLEWLSARGQTPSGYEAMVPKRRVGLAREVRP